MLFESFYLEFISQVFSIDSIPENGIVLDKGWKFQSGDNFDYAKPEYNDSKWQSINPTLDIHDLPQLQKGIVWFRLKLLIDNTIKQQPLSLIIYQSGGSEIYLNGKPVYQFGVVSADPHKIIAYNPTGKPLPFLLSKDSTYVVAIRYALQPAILYTTNTLIQNPALKLRLNNLERSINFYTQENIRGMGSIMFRIGAFLILFILHLAFYLYFPSQRANLYFTLFALFVLFTEVFAINVPHEVKYMFYNRNFLLDFLLLSTIFLLTAIYSLLNQKRGWIYWSLAALLTLGILLNAFTYRFGNIVSLFIIINLINLFVCI